MSLYRSQNISQEKLLVMAANLLHRAFFDSSRLLAKRRYQSLENGATVFLATVKMEDGSELQVNLSLDSTELRDKLNFSAFRQLIGQLLAAYAQTFKDKQPLPTFSSADNRRWSYLIPALHQGAERSNVLILGLDVRKPAAMTLELMFIDPTQFQPRAEAETAV
jgi:hypothetical protein